MLNKRIFIPLILIALPVILGLWARYQAVPYWQEHKKEFYVEGRPIFTAYDSYYFARLAEDYKLGVFEPGGEDRLRFVPDYVPYPSVIHFYSWLFAKLSALTGKPVENLSFWLIPILAVLFAVPLVLLLIAAEAPLAGLAGAVVGGLSLIYVIRTGLNRLDTDSIVLFSFFAIPLAVFLASRAKTERAKYLYLLLLALFSNLFYWGYLHPDLNFVLWGAALLFWLFPIVSDWLRQRRLDISPLKSTNLWKDLGLLTLAFNPYILFAGFFSLISRLGTYVFHFGKPVEGNFPNVQISISELQKMDLSQIAQLTVGNEILLYLSFGGLLLFAIFRLRAFLLLLPTLLIGLLSFKGASRFAMFLAPMVGIGLGFLLDLLWGYLKSRLQLEDWKEIFSLSGLAIVLSAVLAFANSDSFKFKPTPIMNSAVASAFIEIGKQTPPNAWIYTWWDYGYAIQYYARRATFHDGGSQYSPKTYFVALGFTSPDPAVGFNVTRSLTVCGAKCIDNLLKEGKTPKQIKETFVKGELLKGKNATHPVYWVFTQDLIGKFYWISYFGSWDFELRKGEHHPIFSSYCVPKNPNLYACNIGGRPALFDSQRLILLLGRNNAVPIKYFAVRTPQRLDIFENRRFPYGNVLEKVYTYINGTSAWFFTDIGGFESNFNNMYILRKWDKRYFERVKERFPDYLFFRVR